MNDIDIVQALKEFYSHYEPDRVPDDNTLQGVAQKFAGKERELWQSLYQHYSPDAMPTDEQLNTISAYENPFKKKVSGEESTSGSLDVPVQDVDTGTKELSFLGRKENKDTYGEDILEALKGGAAQAGVLLSRIPRGVLEVARMSTPLQTIPIKEREKALVKSGFSRKEARKAVDALAPAYDAIDAIENNKVTDYLEDKSDQFLEASKRYDESIQELFKEGETRKAFEAIGIGAAQSLPVTLAAAFGGTAGLAGIGFGVAGEKLEEMEHKPELDMSQQQEILNATLNGMAEVLFEAVGTAQIGQLVKSAIKRGTKETAKQAVKEGLQAWIKDKYKKVGLWAAPIQEGVSEALTQLSQNLVNIHTGESPDLDPMEGVIDAASIGAATGLGFTAAGKTIESIKPKQDERQEGQVQPESTGMQEGQTITESKEDAERTRSRRQEDVLLIEEQRLKELDVKEGEVIQTPEGEGRVASLTEDKIVLEGGTEVDRASYEQGINERVDRELEAAGANEGERVLAKEIAKGKQMITEPTEEVETTGETGQVQEVTEPLAGPPTIEQLDLSKYDEPTRERLSVLPNVKKALGDVEIFVHDTNESISEAARQRGAEVPKGKVAEGFTVGSEIHLNAKAMSSSTAFHEAAHPIIRYKMNKDPEVFFGMYEQLREEFPEMQEFSEQYEARKDELSKRRFEKSYNELSSTQREKVDSDVSLMRKEEELAEFVARVADGKIELKGSKFEKVKEFFNKILESIGLKQRIEKPEDVKRFAKTVADALKTGKPTESQISGDVQFSLSNPPFNPQDPSIIQARKAIKATIPYVQRGQLSKQQVINQVAQGFNLNPATVQQVYQAGTIKGALENNISIFNNLPFKEQRERVTTFWKKWFSSNKGAPNDLRRLREWMHGSLMEVSMRAKNTVQYVDKLIKKHKADVELVDQYLRQTIKGEDVNSIPQEVRDALDQMRADIEALQINMIDEGYIRGDMIGYVHDNTGYLHRAYRIHWDKNYRPTEEIRQKAISFYVSEIRNQIDEGKREVPNNIVDRDRWIQDKAEQAVNDLLEKHQSKFRRKKGGRYAPSKDESIFKQRQDLPKELRDLLGEYSDPLNAYMITMFELSKFLESRRYMKRIAEIGYGKFLWRKSDPDRPKDANSKLDFNRTEISSIPFQPEEGEPISLRDLYARKEFHDAFMEVEDIFDKFQFPQFWLTLNAWVNKGKTVYSPATQAKNYFGNIPIALSNGYWNVFSGLPGAGKAWKTIVIGLYGGAKYGTPAQKSAAKKGFEATIKKLTQYGLINQNVSLGVIRDQLGKGNITEAMNREVFNAMKATQSKASKPLKKLDDWLTARYENTDNIFKVLGYMKEADRYSRAIYGKPYNQLNDVQQAEVDEIAVELAKNLLPNYSRMGRIPRLIAMNPAVGNFIAFTTESFRVQYNSLNQAFRELAHPNQKVKDIGINRMAGQVVAASLRAAVVGGLSTMAGAGIQGLAGALTDDEEEKNKQLAIRSFVPPWLKKNDIIIQEAKDGKVLVWDFSGTDPFGTAQQFMNTFIVAYNEAETGRKDTGEAVGDVAGGIIRETYKSFLDPTILTEYAIRTAFTGKDVYGRDIEDIDIPVVGEDPMGKFTPLLRYLYHAGKTIGPGVVASGTRVMEREDKIATLTGQIFGINPYEIDVQKSFSVKISEFRKEDSGPRKKLINKARQIMNDDNLTGAEKRESMKELEVQRRKVLDGYKQLYEDAKLLGVPVKELNDIVSRIKYHKGGQGDLDVDYIIKGRYKPWKIGDFIYNK